MTHHYRHRVRYRECDPMGVAYHTHVLDSDACKGDGLTGLHWPDRRTVKVDTAPDDLQLSCSAGVVAA